MSEARRIADVRLAKGEITAEQHAAILSQLSAGGSGQEALKPTSAPSVTPQPSIETPPAPSAKMQTDVDVPQLRKGAKSWGTIGVIIFGIWFFVFKVRSDWMEGCVSDPRIVDGTCHFSAAQNLFFICLTLGWLVGFGFAAVLFIQAENQNQKR